MNESHDSIEGIPTDELRVPVDLTNVEFYPRVVEDPATIRVLPTAAPLRFVGVCLLIPIAVGAWLFTFGPLNPVRFPGALWQAVTALLMFLLATVTGFGFYGLIIHSNRQEMKQGPYLVLDKMQGTLSLPRQSIEIQQKDLVAILELTCRVIRDRDFAPGSYVHVSLLYRSESNSIERCPIIAASSIPNPSKRITQLLADYYQVPLHRIERDDSSPYDLTD